jgi:hypothetical protein
MKNSAERLNIVDPLNMTFQDYEVYLHVGTNVDLRDDGLKQRYIFWSLLSNGYQGLLSWG